MKMRETISKADITVIRWAGSSLHLLDQRRLPAREEYLTLDSVDTVIAAIRQMVVRGAPAIGITAAYGMVISASEHSGQTDWLIRFKEDGQQMILARPTAINLRWAVERMVALAVTLSGANQADPVSALLAEAKAIHAEDKAACRAMGQHGADYIGQGSSVMTHCNTGALATGGIGTALGVIRTAWSAGKLEQVYAGETRPWLQGARLTAWELVRAEIPVQLITDSAAAFLMQKKRVQWVIVGADRVTANGDVINKIGTYNLAVLCRYHGIGFMVVAPVSTIDYDTAEGQVVTIEQRDADEVLTFNGVEIAASGARVWNPAFDVTPADLVTCLVTERGVIEGPNQEKIAALSLSPVET